MNNNYFNGFNNYPQYPYGYQANMQRQGQMFNSQMAQPQPQQMPMQTQQPQTQFEIPLREVKFVTSEEAKAYIVFPNTAVLLIDKQQGLAYLKSADNMGQSFMETFSFKKYEQGQETALKDTKEEKPIDLSNFVQKDDLKVFASLKDYNELFEKVEELNKKIEILSKPQENKGIKANGTSTKQ